MAFALSSCGKSDSGSGTSGGGKQASGMEGAAQDAALAEVKKHWSKGADGWITARNSGTSFAPVRFIREMRDLTVEGVRAADLTEADKMNGLEWAGEVSFKQSPCREAGDQGIVRWTRERDRLQATRPMDSVGRPSAGASSDPEGEGQLASPSRYLASPWQHSQRRRLCQRGCESRRA